MQAEQLLPGGGEMGAVIRAFDWSNTPLGDLSTWSHLLSAATMCLNSRLPMAIWWGKDLILLYNDAWRSLLGSSHPTALGRPGREGCAEIWQTIGAPLESVLATGEPTKFDFQGYEQAYSPIFIAGGQVGGVFAVATETTQAALQQEAQKREQALRIEAETAKANLESVLASIRDGFFTLSRDWRYTYINDRQTEIIRMRREDVIGKNVWEVFPDIVDTEFYHQVHRAMNEQIPVLFEYYYPTWDRWFENRVYPTPDGIAILCADISDRKKTQEALHQSEELFRKMAETIGDVFWMSAPGEQRLLYASPAYEKIWGRSLDSLYANWNEWIEAIHPIDRERIRTFFLSQSFLNGYDEEYRIIRPDGSICWVRDRGYPITEPDEQVYRIAGIATDITARKQARAALHQSEAQFRQLADAMPQMVWIANPNGNPEYVSQGWIEYTGLTLLQTANQADIGSVMHPDDLDPTYEIWASCLETGSLYQTEFRIKRAKDSVYRWFLCRAVPIKTEQGQIVRWYGTLTDIDDRKQAEEKLQASEERFRQIAETIQDVFWSADFEQQQILYVSPGYQRIWGRPEESLYRNFAGWIETIHPEDREKVREVGSRCLDTGNLEVEYRIVRPDGSVRWVRDRGFVVPDQNGQTRQVVGIAGDITDLKQVETALRDSEERLRLALESAELGAWDYNPATGELKWDIRCKAMFGLSPSAAVDYDVFLQGLHPDDRSSTHLVVQQALNPASGGKYDIEYRTVGLEDGIERWISANGKAFFNPKGEAIRFIGTVLDISDRKSAEAFREQLLQRERAAREEAETANRVKDEFLAVLSHELRSPLNPILGWAKILQTRKLDAKATANALETIERNAKLQTQLIEDLLDVSRILRGKLVLNVYPVNLVSVIQSAIETVRLAAEAKAIQIQTIFAADAVRVSGDSARLQQIVWNLLTNAVKFTPSGGRVEIYLQRVGSDAVIRVKDTGKGINQEFLPYVFEYFRQEDSKTTRKFGGLGLGLAIVRYLTELHGGVAQVESPGEGLGSTFTVKIPLLDDYENFKNEDSSASLKPKELLLTNLRIIAVDDEPDMRELMMAILQQSGADVLVAASAAEALLLLDQYKPDIIISDIGMPVIDGYMFMRQVRKRSLALGGEVKAIALTAYAAESDRFQALAAGFQKHISKPIEPDELIKAILSLIEISQN